MKMAADIPRKSIESDDVEKRNAKSRSSKPLVKDLNGLLICILCGGYYVDATTIVECIHSFCRSCIVKYLRKNKFCPICEVQVHKTKPLLNLRPDTILQSLVYKAIPDLYNKELLRRKEYELENITETGQDDEQLILDKLISDQTVTYYSPSDLICLRLEYTDNEAWSDLSLENEEKDVAEERKLLEKRASLSQYPKERYLQCEAAVTIGHLAKFIRCKYNLESSHQVEIVKDGEILTSDFSLIDVAYSFRWDQKLPLHLNYHILRPSLIRINVTPISETASEKEDPLPSSPSPKNKDYSDVDDALSPTKSHVMTLKTALDGKTIDGSGQHKSKKSAKPGRVKSKRKCPSDEPLERPEVVVEATEEERLLPAETAELKNETDSSARPLTVHDSNNNDREAAYGESDNKADAVPVGDNGDNGEESVIAAPAEQQTTVFGPKLKKQKIYDRPAEEPLPEVTADPKSADDAAEKSPRDEYDFEEDVAAEEPVVAAVVVDHSNKCKRKNKKSKRHHHHHHHHNHHKRKPPPATILHSPDRDIMKLKVKLNPVIEEPKRRSKRDRKKRSSSSSNNNNNNNNDNSSNDSSNSNIDTSSNDISHNNNNDDDDDDKNHSNNNNNSNSDNNNSDHNSSDNNNNNNDNNSPEESSNCESPVEVEIIKIIDDESAVSTKVLAEEEQAAPVDQTIIMDADGKSSAPVVSPDVVTENDNRTADSALSDLVKSNQKAFADKQDSEKEAEKVKAASAKVEQNAEISEKPEKPEKPDKPENSEKPDQAKNGEDASAAVKADCPKVETSSGSSGSGTKRASTDSLPVLTSLLRSPSSIVVSKITAAEKVKMEQEKAAMSGKAQNDNKPALEILVVNGPPNSSATTDANSRPPATKAATPDPVTAQSSKSGTTRQIRPPPPAIPLEKFNIMRAAAAAAASSHGSGEKPSSLVVSQIISKRSPQRSDLTRPSVEVGRCNGQQQPSNNAGSSGGGGSVRCSPSPTSGSKRKTPMATAPAIGNSSANYKRPVVSNGMASSSVNSGNIVPQTDRALDLSGNLSALRNFYNANATTASTIPQSFYNVRNMVTSAPLPSPELHSGSSGQRPLKTAASTPLSTSPNKMARYNNSHSPLSSHSPFAAISLKSLQQMQQQQQQLRLNSIAASSANYIARNSAAATSYRNNSGAKSIVSMPELNEIKIGRAKMGSTAASSSSVAAVEYCNGGGGGKPVVLNQTVRHIPNPSMLFYRQQQAAAAATAAAAYAVNQLKKSTDHMRRSQQPVSFSM